MIWDCEQLITDSKPVTLPCEFNSQLLAIEVISENQRDTWFESGYLELFVNLGGKKFLAENFQLDFGGQLVRTSYRNFQLRYQAQPWMENTFIRIKQLSNLEIEEISTVGINAGVPERLESTREEVFIQNATTLGSTNLNDNMEPRKRLSSPSGDK
jgi:hypothetical protein